MALTENKVKDDKLTKLGKDKKKLKWKKLKHDPENIECLHCKYEEAENSLENHIATSNDDDTMTVKDENNIDKIVTRGKTTILRGKHDDVIGWSTEWL